MKYSVELTANLTDLFEANFFLSDLDSHSFSLVISKHVALSCSSEKLQNLANADCV